MSLILPDSIIAKTIGQAFDAIRNDFRTHVQNGQEYKSFLHKLFYDLRLGRYDYYENVKTLFITTPEDPNHITANLSYDQNDGKVNRVYVTLASENEKDNSIGQGIGNYDNQEYGSVDGDTQNVIFSRMYAATYYVVLQTENRNALVILYNLIQAILIQLTDHFHIEGLINLKIGGQDIRMYNSIPDKIFQKAIAMTFQYEKNVPDILTEDIIREIRLNWLPEGATVAQGPIIISTQDDVSDSDSSL